jgi:predicted RNase H-like HicB family nuclease
MNDIKYELIIYWSAQDESFIVEIPELAGCKADGHTYEEAVANARLIINDWIEIAIGLGREIPKPKGKLMYA